MKKLLNSKKYLSHAKMNIKRISSYKILKENCNDNMIYVLYKVEDNKLRLTMEGSLEKYSSNDYKVIGSKVGSEREFELTNMVLSEIDLNTNYNDIKNALIHLKLLGYTIRNKKKLNKRLYLYA